ncbi:hypothetical protein P5P86_18815 [Nocardioides sp. BP30]|uniref:hypothetical protein n=1 Tax=Nocardioides sp. BP30 TaxID=3036374 RepID=UPI00246911A7|nr:hypothetical protein [Nocardioides sp. BP30]WGL51992.1 hypothetical protein P5P86_18815 [Nocardioides sp. BP30]
MLTATAFLVAGVAGGVVAGPAHADGDGQQVFSFADSRIDEASALVVLPGGLFATTNDSGDTGRVFVVDGGGRTVGVTNWERSPRDVEALAPAPDGEVWVGDIGDNAASRPHIQVAEVPVGPTDRTVHPTVYTLVYPDGAHDAETLLCDPSTGRLYVATKGWLGGRLYAAPEHLSTTGENRLTAVGAVMPMATDGVFLPGGHAVLIRGYFGATTYAWPSMDKIASFRLPDQPQGEGVGVRPDGTAYLSSEGLHAQVLRFELPAAALAGPSASGPGASGPGASGSSAPAPVEAHRAGPDASGRQWWPWAVGGVIGLAALGVLVRSLRRR